LSLKCIQRCWLIRTAGWRRYGSGFNWPGGREPHLAMHRYLIVYLRTVLSRPHMITRLISGIMRNSVHPLSSTLWTKVWTAVIPESIWGVGGTDTNVSPGIWVFVLQAARKLILSLEYVLNMWPESEPFTICMTITCEKDWNDSRLINKSSFTTSISVAEVSCNFRREFKITGLIIMHLYKEIQVTVCQL
jgi:hypothetical protein